MDPSIAPGDSIFFLAGLLCLVEIAFVVVVAFIWSAVTWPFRWWRTRREGRR